MIITTTQGKMQSVSRMYMLNTANWRYNHNDDRWSEFITVNRNQLPKQVTVVPNSQSLSESYFFSSQMLYNMAKHQA